MRSKLDTEHSTADYANLIDQPRKRSDAGAYNLGDNRFPEFHDRFSEAAARVFGPLSRAALL